jgi:ribosome-associated translation inhibitor RaiA
MTTRKEYVEQLKQKLDLWNDEITKLEGKARTAKTDLRIDYEMHLEALRKHREDATAKLKELQASGEGAWQELRAGIDAAWSTMQEAIERAASHFRK